MTAFVTALLWACLCQNAPQDAVGAGPEPSTMELGAFVPEISSGRGWIALVAIYLGNKTPWGIFIASFVFGLAESVSNYAQGAIKVPVDFILALPYIFTVIAMIVYSIFRHARATRP